MRGEKERPKQRKYFHIQNRTRIVSISLAITWPISICHEIKYSFVITDPEKELPKPMLNTDLFKTVIYTPAPEIHIDEPVK